MNDPNLWNHVSVDGEDIVIAASFGDPEIQAFLSDTIQQQLKQKGLAPAQLPYIQHFVQQAGWEGLPAADDYVLAAQLSEPDTDAFWSFKVVLRSKRGTVYWSPSKRRMDELIDKVLPEKWRPHSEEIAQQQQLLLSLCPLWKATTKAGCTMRNGQMPKCWNFCATMRKFSRRSALKYPFHPG
nr:hypothetical protein [Planococcus glaciei]